MYNWDSIEKSVESLKNMQSVWIRRELKSYKHTKSCDRLFFRHKQEITVEVAAIAQDWSGNYYVVPPTGNIWNIPYWDAKKIRVLGSIEGKYHEERRAHTV